MAVLLMESLLALLLLPAVESVTWSDELKDGEPVYACAGGSLLLPWNVSEENRKEGILDIQWFFNGRSQEMVAVFAHDNFLAMPTFSKRVQHVERGGLFFKEVEVADTGNYTIEVSAHDAVGEFITIRHTAMVFIGDSLMTTDGSMYLTPEEEAKWDNSDQQFHVVLSCGTFTYLTYPPFEVEWTHPDGSKENSTDYTDGKFHLLLANPIKGGNYSCRIPLHSADTACLPTNISEPVTATKFINSKEGRLTVLEAQQRALRTQNGKLKGVNSNLKTEVASLKDELEDVINVTNTRDGESQISFHARVSSHQNVYSGSPVVPNDVVDNQGNAFSSSTGRFTAPINGTYFFAATTWNDYGSSSYHYKADAEIVVDSSMICAIQSSANNEVGSCQAVASLRAGQNVWLRCQGNRYRFAGSVTAFTGFLISKDF